uniref:FLZ-type domain-containing protein n=1 Tax=Setaria digitata TaxID=48799 RepID=A0A915PWN3_9BILA
MSIAKRPVSVASSARSTTSSTRGTAALPEAPAALPEALASCHFCSKQLPEEVFFRVETLNVKTSGTPGLSVS